MARPSQLVPSRPPQLSHLHSTTPNTHLEPLLPSGIVNSSDINNLLVKTLRVIPQESQNLNNSRRRDVERQLVLVDAELLDILGQTSSKVLAVLVDRGVDGTQRIGGIDASRLAEGRGRGLGLRQCWEGADTARAEREGSGEAAQRSEGG